MAGCYHCGTSTGTHWPNCPNYSYYRQPVITKRTESERSAFVDGYRACLKSWEKGDDVAVAQAALDLLEEMNT